MATTADCLPPLSPDIDPNEWDARIDLAAAFRIVALYGWDDLICEDSARSAK
jgi:hypothetical protein